MEELREVMVSMGEGPLQEKEFSSFIKVIIIYFYFSDLNFESVSMLILMDCWTMKVKIFQD